MNVISEMIVYPFFDDLDLKIEQGFVIVINDKRDGFFLKVNLSSLDGDLPLALSYGVYILQRFNTKIWLQMYNFDTTMDKRSPVLWKHYI